MKKKGLVTLIILIFAGLLFGSYEIAMYIIDKNSEYIEEANEYPTEYEPQDGNSASMESANNSINNNEDITIEEQEEQEQQEQEEQAEQQQDEEQANDIGEMDSETIPVEAQDNSIITPSTKFIYQTYYTLDGKLIEEEKNPPYNLLGMTREELEDYYENMQLVVFSDEKVILRESIDNTHVEGYYIIKAYKGQIGIFYNYIEDFEDAFSLAVLNGDWEEENKDEFLEKFLFENEEQYLREILNVSLDLFSTEEREKLEEGILIYGEDELIRLLENYTS